MKPMMLGNGLTTLRNEMDRILDRMWEADPMDRTPSEWTPAIDLSETKAAFIVTVEVPGMDPADIKLSLQDQVLTLSGERKKEEDRKDERFYRIERSYGAFARSIRLPVPVDEESVKASSKNGVLTIQIQKADGGKGVFIPIQAA